MRDSLFQWTAGAGLHGHGNKAGQNFQGGGQGGRGGLRTQHGGKRIGGLAARASRNYVINGLLQLIASALNALEIVANRAGYGLFDTARLWWHTQLWAFSRKGAPFAILRGRARGVKEQHPRCA